MKGLTSRLVTGIAFAIFATLCWALNFIVPYITGSYTIFDFLATRFLIVGVIGIVLIAINRAHLSMLSWPLRYMAAGLGAMGYFGYSTLIASGAQFGGPVLTPAFIGMVPVLLALLGNVHSKVLAWRRLALPLCVLAFGLLLINLTSLQHPLNESVSVSTGIAFSVAAVMLWLVFSFLNQNSLEKISPGATGVWTGLMMAGSALALLVLMPLAQAFGLFHFPHQGYDFASAGTLYGWAFLIGVFSSLLGAWAWNRACRDLPMVLSGQLIALESLFAAVLALAFERRLPSWNEALGIMTVLMGAVLAVQVIFSAKGQKKARMQDEKPSA
ncbi:MULTISPECIES: DMT family transporter [unclassified Pseudomonas]|uniref:DMT family transporter n=1 Tax=unclassified Pseudomonas TaxID=196821 RepID=UPI00257E0461|nr:MULTISPECIES: DMT family transporter [unclassified Pseudomonas]